MLTLNALARLFAGLALALSLLVAFRPQLTRARGGKIFAIIALFVLPLLASWTGGNEKMESSKGTKFCLSCHVMEGFGRSLHVDNRSYVPAAHYQNNRIPRDQVCYSCHTDYTFYGGLESKWRGVQHVYVQYFGALPRPERIRLYSPFRNAACLRCHEGSRSFEESAAHPQDADLLSQFKSDAISCTSGGCHDIIHDISSLQDVKFWKEAQ